MSLRLQLMKLALQRWRYQGAVIFQLLTIAYHHHPSPLNSWAMSCHLAMVDIKAEDIVAYCLSSAGWLKSFNLPMMVVEPLIQNSQFIADGRHNSGVLSFSDLFDINHFNKLTTGKTRYARLSKWDDFIHKSPKNVIYVIIAGSDNAHQQGIYIEWEMGQTNECSTKYSELKFLEQLGYCVVKVVKSILVRPTPFTASEMNDIVFNTWKPDEVTIIFSG